jgi:GNAT superfamily N-acetyltransferase
VNSPTTPSPGDPIWYVRHERGPRHLWHATAWRGPGHADGDVVDASDVGEGAELVWRTSGAERGLLTVHVPEHRAPGAPPLWFVQVDEPGARPAATNLVAFPTDDLPPGTVVSRYTFATMGVRNDQQAGALRWYRDGLVHQIYVAPDWRRRLVGTSMLHVAGAWHQANGWSGHIHGDGRRTVLGEQFLVATQQPNRFAPLRETMPPMDPSPG